MKSRYPDEPILSTAIVLFVVVSLLIVLSFYLSLGRLREEATLLATIEARANWNKDQAFRGWATRHGGLYVRPTERTPPNPYLAHLPDRDLTTVGGTELTLMNPAYMMRQLTKEYEETYGIKGKITGKVLLNPINAPDPWERRMLKKFEQGLTEVVEETTIDGSPYIRLMKPMVMKEGCVKCHGHLGFKVGDIRGGVSVSIPLNPYLEATSLVANTIMVSHGLVWLLGCAGIGGFTISAKRRDQERARLRRQLENNQEMLEIRVKERTQELMAKEDELLASQAREHYANKMAALGEMAGGMAHEINSPLQAITLTTFRMKKYLDDMNLGDIRSSTANIENSAKLISKIVESLRHMSRDSTDDPYVEVAIEEIIDDVVGITSERYRTNNIQFDVSYHDDCQEAALICQRLQISQIIINLLNNAFDAALESSDKWIRLEVFEREDVIDVVVTDSGQGVPPAVRERIFEPLFTSKDIGKGTGLGLSISAEIAKRHAGTLELDGNSKYTRFVLCLRKDAGGRNA